MLAIDPDRLNVRPGLGRSILTNGPIAIRNLGRAEELVRTALDHDAGNLADRGDLGIILYRHGRYREAVAVLLSRPSLPTQTPWTGARWA